VIRFHAVSLPFLAQVGPCPAITNPYCLRARMRIEYHFMNRFFDMDDRARLPWRFHGASRTIRARL